MKNHSTLTWRVCAVSLCLAVLGNSGCEGLNAKKQADETPPAPLKLSPPRGRTAGPEKERWTTLIEPNGQYFLQSKSGMDDVVSLYGTVTEDASVQSLGDIAARLRSGQGFLSVAEKQVLGVPVVRFERLREDHSDGSEKVRRALNARGRTMPSPFHVRTIGAVVLRPGRAGEFVTVACERCSHHGEIGEYYEELFEDFLAAFIADNCIGLEPY